MDTGVRIVEGWDNGKQMLIEAQRPLGIMVICADPGVKNKFVYGTLERAINMICVTPMACSKEKLKESLEESGVVCLSLTADASCSLTTRRNMVTMLRQANVHEVYGIYLKDANRVYPEVDSAAATLEANPPAAEEYDGLIII